MGMEWKGEGGGVSFVARATIWPPARWEKLSDGKG